MKKTCIIHIGLHKTGTSSIQNSLYKNRALLKSGYNINYFGRQANHGVLFTLFADDLTYFHPLKYLGISGNEAIKNFKDGLNHDLKAAIRDNISRYFVISGEGLSFLQTEGITRLRKFLSPYFDDVQIHAYVRDPISYVNSVGQQHIQGGMTFADIKRDTFALADPDTRSAISQPGSVYPFYRLRLEPYISSFGPEKIRISNFSAITKRGDDVLSHFMRHALDIENIPDGFDRLRVNESLGPDAVYLAEALNKKTPLFLDNKLNPKRARGLMRHLSSLDSEGSFILPEFDFSRLAKIAMKDAVWLKTATDGRIDYTHMEPPGTSALLWPDLSPIALSLNDSLLKDDENAVNKDMFRTLWLCSQNPDAARKSVNVDSLVNRCHDAKAIANFAHNLRGLEFHDFALTAVARAIYLSDQSGDTELHDRLTLMKTRMLQAA